jgi:hypothetical protein
MQEIPQEQQTLIEGKEKVIPVFLTDSVEDGWPRKMYLDRSFLLYISVV